MQETNTDLIEILQSPVDIKRLIKKLKFSSDDLENAAEIQPSLRLEAGKFRAQIGLKEANARRRLNRIVGKKSLRLRKSGDYKTEVAVKHNSITRHKGTKIPKRV